MERTEQTAATPAVIISLNTKVKQFFKVISRLGLKFQILEVFEQKPSFV